MKTYAAPTLLLCGGFAILAAPALAATPKTDEDLAELIEHIQTCVEEAGQTSNDGKESNAAVLAGCAAKADLRAQANSGIKTVLTTKIVAQVPTQDWSPSERASFQDQTQAAMTAAVNANQRYALASATAAPSARYELIATIAYRSTGHGNRQLDQWINQPKKIHLTLELRDALGVTPPSRREMVIQLLPQVRPRNASIRNSDWFFKAGETLEAASKQLLEQRQDNPRLAKLERSSNGKLQINSAAYQNITISSWMVLIPETLDVTGTSWQLARPSAAQRFTGTQAEMLIDPANGDTRQCAESGCLAWIP
jgi:hypothetical protein